MSVSRPSLLLSRILAFRDISPLLVLTDSTFQSAFPLLVAFETAARAAKLRVVRIGWRRESEVCTLQEDAAGSPPRTKPIETILSEIRTLTSAAGSQRMMLAIPDLNDFLAKDATHLTTFLSSLISLSPGRVSVCAVYHADVPLLEYPAYLPTPEVLLRYLATTVLSVQSLTHVLLSRDARRKAKTSPVELDLEGRDIFTVIGSNDPRIVVDLEHRRRSGRGIHESVVFDVATSVIQATHEVPGLDSAEETESERRERERHQQQREANAHVDEEELGFKISLSDRQKAVRDGVVLPHFAAQVEIDGDQSGNKGDKSDGGSGGGHGNQAPSGGGHIYYEPDSGDDFDHEDPDDDLML